MSAYVAGLQPAFIGLHVTACLFVAGQYSLLLLAGRPPQVLRQWERRLDQAARLLIGIALASGLAEFILRSASFAQKGLLALRPDDLSQALFDTRSGQVWLIRQGLLWLLLAFIWLVEPPRGGADWFVARLQTFLLAAGSLVLLSLTGHMAASANSLRPILTDMLHLLGAGIWAGGLLPLALLLFHASHCPGGPARYAIRAIHRFSRMALGIIVLMVATGSYASLLLVQDFVGLLGTRHGHLLLIKCGLLALALLFALASRRRLPGLHQPLAAGSVARQMAQFIAVEAGLVLLLLLIATMLTVTPPAIHADSSWPLPFRLQMNGPDWQGLVAVPWLSVAGIGIVVLAGLVCLARGGLPRWHRAVLPACVLSFAVAGTVTLQPEFLPAVPTSFARPAVAFAVDPVMQGQAVFQANCQRCHAGKSPGAVTANLLPGEIFWRAGDGHGADSAGNGARLDDDARWELVHYLALLAASADGRVPAGGVTEAAAWLQAPDFTIAMGSLTPWSLRDYRGRKMVLLVFYDLPASRERMTELARRYGTLSVLGVEVVAIGPHDNGNAIAELGAPYPASFPIVTSGNANITATYRMFAPDDAHTEMLVDRQGYIRAIWRGRDVGLPEAGDIQAAVERLNEEKLPLPLPELHIH